MFEASVATRSRRPGRTSFSSRDVLRSLTPQEMSKPTPPGETTPVLSSNAATPPIGNP